MQVPKSSLGSPGLEVVGIGAGNQAGARTWGCACGELGVMKPFPLQPLLLPEQTQTGSLQRLPQAVGLFVNVLLVNN